MTAADTLRDNVFNGLEAVINHCLRLDPETWQGLDELGDRLLAVELRGLNLTVYIQAGADGLRLSGHSQEVPHTVLKGTPLTLLQMVLGEGDRRRFPEGLEIAGDVETARRFQSLLAGLEIDWEEQLSRITGDVAAHQAGNAVRTLRRWCREAGAKLEQDTAEYLREEQALLPYRDEVEDFLTAVDALRDDSERLALRVERLQQRCVAQRKSDGGEGA